MPLDILSLLAVTAVNLFALSALLPLIMGRGVSPAARHAQYGILLQALAWACMILASYAMDHGHPAWDRFWSTLSIGGNALAQWWLYRALEGWLGPRPLRRLLLVLVVLTPLGYALGFGHYAFRVGWANLLLAAVLVVVAWATLHPRTPTEGRARFVLLGCLLTMAGFTLARGILGAFTDQYPSFRTPHPVNLAAALATNVTLVLGVVAVLTAWRDEADQQLRQLALTDPLTALPNRRGFEASAQSMLAHAQRHQLPLTALMLDLDHFKCINDVHGHDAGDQALRLFARLLRDNARGTDIVARLGGEEFGVLLLHQRANEAHSATAFEPRLRQALHQTALAELGFALDFSAGMATLQPDERQLASLLARADSALYAAKSTGRGHMQIA